MAWSPQQIVTVTCIILIIILGAAYSSLEQQESMDSYYPSYHLEVNGNTAYSNGNLTLVVGNNGNNLSKILSINELDDNDNSPTLLFSSILATQTGKLLKNLSFAEKSIYTIQTEDEFPVLIYDVKVSNLSSGSYEGFLYLTGKNPISIPINLSTEPKISQAVLIVVIGTLLSILLWEIFFYLIEAGS